MCDGDNYGRFLVYQFPKEKRVLGPQQVETKIDQDRFLSGQLTLWDQRGSRVIRGNVLAIPVEQTLTLGVTGGGGRVFRVLRDCSGDPTHVMDSDFEEWSAGAELAVPTREGAALVFALSIARPLRWLKPFKPRIRHGAENL